MCFRKKKPKIATNLAVLIAAPLLLILGTLGFMTLEPVVRGSWVNSLYLTTATLTTVGYGDYSPSTPASRALMMVFSLIGLGVFGGPVLSELSKLHSWGPGNGILRAGVSPIVAMASGTVAFVILEGWSFEDAAYFCFVTGTTVGYGDHPPLKTPGGKLTACVYMLFAISCIAELISEVQKRFAGLIEYWPLQPFTKAIFQPGIDTGVTLLTVGTLGFMTFEPTVRNNWVDALYLTTTTLSTVGYGDLSPTTSASRAFMVVLSVCGLDLFCGPMLAKAGTWTHAIPQTRQVPQAVLNAAVTLAVGTMAFVALEGWRPEDALYFCVVTSTTVGYGDHLDLPSRNRSWWSSKTTGIRSDTGKLAVCIYIWFSIDCMAGLLNLLRDRFVFTLDKAKLKVS